MPAGSRFSVALHTLAVIAYLEKQGVAKVSSELIAKSVGTNAAVIRALLVFLRNAGLVRSKEGRGGGVSLAKDSRKISLREVYAAVEHPAILSCKMSSCEEKCPVSRGMRQVLPPLFAELDQLMIKALGRKTLGGVVNAIDHCVSGNDQRRYRRSSSNPGIPAKVQIKK